MREGKIMRWRGREREKETLGKRGERERKLFRWDVKKKKKKQDVKEWRKRKKQGAEKKKRVNHKNSDLQEWVGRRKEDGGGKEKCKSQTGVPPCGWRREATVPTVALPHPSCSTSLHPECQTASCNPVWCSCQATKHSHSNTHMHARTHANLKTPCWNN